MKTITRIAGLALALSALPAVAQQAAAPAPSTPTASAPAPAVTPANDPAYTYKTQRLNRAAFDALLSKPEQLVVLNIRRPDELTKVGGFPVYLSIQTADVQRSLPFIPRDRLIVTVSTARIAPAPLATFSRDWAFMSSARSACSTTRMKAAF